MKEILSSEDSIERIPSREYLNYPSLILREVKSCKMISEGAKHCWELLYDLSKFNVRRFIDISIKKIKAILSDSKSYRTIQRYLAQLAEHDFITIKKNFDIYGRIENTYLVKVPTFIIDKLNVSTNKVFIKSNNPVSNPVNPRYDIFVQGNKELNIINNNCYSFEKEEILLIDNNSIKSDCALEFEPGNEILEYYPAKEKPSTPSKAVLRHALKQAVKFEMHITSKLTNAQEGVIKQIIAFWTALRYVSSPKECFEWIQSVLLNAKALSKCGNNFLKKINVIFKMIRERRFSRPYAHRYLRKDECQNKNHNTLQKRVKSVNAASDLSTIMGSVLSFEPMKLNHQEQEKIAQLENYEQQIAAAQLKIEATGDTTIKKSYVDLVDLLRFKIQELRCI